MLLSACDFSGIVATPIMETFKLIWFNYHITLSREALVFVFYTFLKEGLFKKGCFISVKRERKKFLLVTK